MKRVVVTGIGLVSSLGASVGSAWDALIRGKSGIVKIPKNAFPVEDMTVKIAGCVGPETGFDVGKYVNAKEQRKMGRFIHFAIAAAAQAVEDSGWTPKNDLESCRSGVLVGSGIGGLIGIEQNAILLHEEGPRKISPFFIPASLVNLASGHISIQHNFRGPNSAVVTACATGSHAIGDAARIIVAGDADVMVCGGTEAAICRLGVVGFAAMKALSTRNDEPEKASRPWDRDRDGFVIGEGAGVLVIEELEHAKRRGAKIYGEIVGYGMSGDAYHMTSPEENGDGGYRAMKMALGKAQLNFDQVDYINAHGTSTPIGDIVELNAVKRLFGDAAYKLSMSSTKSSIGHLLGASGSVEAIFSLLTMCENIMPPTLNLDNPDEGCDLDLIPHFAKEKQVNVVLSNSFGFGGTNASLVFKKFDNTLRL